MPREILRAYRVQPPGNVNHVSADEYVERTFFLKEKLRQKKQLDTIRSSVDTSSPKTIDMLKRPDRKRIWYEFIRKGEIER